MTYYDKNRFKKMWDKLVDEEQGFINVMIDRDNKQNEEIERLQDMDKILRNENINLKLRINKAREIDIKYNKYLQKELAKANSIIIEAREYIEKHKQKGYRTPMSDDYEFWDELNGDEIKGLLEILSKAGNE